MSFDFSLTTKICMNVGEMGVALGQYKDRDDSHCAHFSTWGSDYIKF